MKSLEFALLNRLLQAKDEIRANMIENNVNATGKTMESLTGEISGDNIKLTFKVGYDTSTLEVGFIGKTPAQVIYDWSINKGISLSENERQRFAINTANKIERSGTQRYNQNIDIYSTACETAANDVKTIVKEYLKEVFNNKQ